MMKLYKDECDVCKKWDYCSGYNGLVLCSKCMAKAKENKTESVKKENANDKQTAKKQISLFD